MVIKKTVLGDDKRKRPVEAESYDVVEVEQLQTEDLTSISALSKSPPPVEKDPDPAAEKKSVQGNDRDILLARIETEKKLALIKAWEESEKTIAQNRAYKKLLSIKAWEDSKRACLEAKLKKIEEHFEKKKAKYAEKMMNKAAKVHRAAEENRAFVEAKLGEEIMKVEEVAETYRTTGETPKRLFRCFGC